MSTELQKIAANLASLNEIMTEVVAHTSPDGTFIGLVRDTLRNHSWALGFEFQGERVPEDRKTGNSG